MNQDEIRQAEELRRDKARRDLIHVANEHRRSAERHLAQAGYQGESDSRDRNIQRAIAHSLLALVTVALSHERHDGD